MGFYGHCAQRFGHCSQSRNSHLCQWQPLLSFAHSAHDDFGSEEFQNYDLAKIAILRQALVLGQGPSGTPYEPGVLVNYVSVTCSGININYPRINRKTVQDEGMLKSNLLIQFIHRGTSYN